MRKTSFKTTATSAVLVAIGSLCFSVSAQRFNADGVDLETWNAPQKLVKFFPYYISGVDHKGQPVFTLEFGKWDIRKYFQDGGDKREADIYMDQLVYRFSRAEKNIPYYNGGTGFFAFLADMEGYSLKQLAHVPSVLFVASIVRKFVAVCGDELDYVILFNMNPVASTLVNTVVKPILGPLRSKLETSGTDKSVWGPLLLSRIPKESLAPWYGGSIPLSQYKPIRVYG